MKRILLPLIILPLLMPRPLAACSPPVFPQPETVTMALAAQESGEALPDDQALLADFQKDKDRYFEIYNSGNPCLSAQTSHVFLTVEQQEEMAALADKWRATETVQTNPETPPVYYDVPAEDMLVNME
jgi:hypothetical protein